MLLTFIKSENCTFALGRHNYKGVVHSIKFTCPDRLNCSLPGGFPSAHAQLFGLTVLSVCVFVIRDSFVRKEKKKKKRKKKRRADLCLNHYSCLIKHHLSYLLLLPILLNPSSSPPPPSSSPPPPSCSFVVVLFVVPSLSIWLLVFLCCTLPLSIYRCCKNPADRGRP